MVAIHVTVIATVITVIAIVIHLVTAIGNMEKESKLKRFFKAHSLGVIIILWVLAFVMPLIFKPNNPDKNRKDKLDYYDVSFLSIGALFTGIAFAATFSSLEHQKESLKEQTNLSNKQIDLNIFCETIRLVMDDDRFITCRKYIYSTDFYTDVDEVSRIWNKDKKKIGLEDFRKTFRSNSKTDNQVSIEKEVKERLRRSYEKIAYFCSRMEYLGLVYNEKGAESLIMEYYGRTIVESYRTLHDIIENSKNEDKMKRLYLYYTKLYDSAKLKEKEILESLQKNEG